MSVCAGCLYPISEMDGIEGIIFDFGGTLDTHGEHWYHVMNRAYHESGLELAREAYIYAERHITPLITPEDTMLDLLRKKAGLQAEYMGVDGAGIADRCYAYARDRVNESAVELQKIYGKYRLAIVSNFYGNLEAVLNDYGILSLFDTVVDSSIAGIRKPDPEIFRIAINCLGIPNEKILVVGDSIKNDILPAKSLHCHTFHVEGRGW